MTLGPLMVDVAGARLTPEDREVLEHPLVGSVILFTRNYENPEQVAALVRDLRAVRRPPLLVAVDHEGGRVQRFREGFSRIPNMRIIGHTWDRDRQAGRHLARQVGWLLGAELRAVGIDLAFTPVVDLDFGASEIIGDRAFHRSPEAVAELAISLMGGLKEAGMAATAKHFPGHGYVVADSHIALPVDHRKLADLDQDLFPYRRLVDNGLPSIMAAHVVFDQVDTLPASLSARWIDGYLRRELGFSGCVFADDLSMAGAAHFGDVVARAELAWAAGCDVLPICNDRRAVHQALERFRPEARPASQLRLARLHGPAGAPDLATLRASTRWQECVAAAGRCLQPPPLTLQGDA